MRDDISAEAGGLIDLTELSLHDLDESDESCLGDALRRVLRSREDDAEPIAGFSSST
jgi:FXSXX-COOH protein